MITLKDILVCVLVFMLGLKARLLNQGFAYSIHSILATITLCITNQQPFNTDILKWFYDYVFLFGVPKIESL